MEPSGRQLDDRMNATALPPRPVMPAAAGLLACYLIWGSTYLAIRFALESFPPFFQMGTRFLAAGALLMAWVLWRGRGGGVRLPSAREWRNALVIGALMLGGGMGLTASAEQHVGSGLVAAFIAVVPMLVCGWGLLFGQRRPPGVRRHGGGRRGRADAAARRERRAPGPRVHRRRDARMVAGLRALDDAPATGARAGRLRQRNVVRRRALDGDFLALGEQFAGPPQPLALASWLYLVVFGSLIGFSAYLYLLANASPAVATSYAFVNPVIALALGVSLEKRRSRVANGSRAQ